MRLIFCGCEVQTFSTAIFTISFVALIVRLKSASHNYNCLPCLEVILVQALQTTPKPFPMQALQLYFPTHLLMEWDGITIIVSLILKSSKIKP